MCATCEPENTAWSVLAVPLFCMPSLLPVTAATVNYAPVVFVGFVVIASVWYAAWGRKNYRGPPTEQVGQPVSALHSPPDAVKPVDPNKKD